MTQNHAESMRWFRKAADQGDALAQRILGLAYNLGEGVPQSYAEAVRWSRKAADQGDAPAQYQLARAYSEGQGVLQDNAEAYFWANIATALEDNAKDTSFAQLRDAVGAGLSPTKLSTTQKRCRQWMEEFEKRKARK